VALAGGDVKSLLLNGEEGVEFAEDVGADDVDRESKIETGN
jgi:hypothetical protein